MPGLAPHHTGFQTQIIQIPGLQLHAKPDLGASTDWHDAFFHLPLVSLNR